MAHRASDHKVVRQSNGKRKLAHTVAVNTQHQNEMMVIKEREDTIVDIPMMQV